jgi:HSP20 family protein
MDASIHALMKGSMMNIARRNDSPLTSIYRPMPVPMPINDQLGRVVENMFEDFFAPFTPYSALAGGEPDGAASPPINVAETADAYRVEVELPGVSKEDIKVAVDNRRVTIEAEEKREQDQKEGERLIYAERNATKYARSFTLPSEVDDAGAQAKFENGVLTLTLPKKQPPQPKQLAIQ